MLFVRNLKGADRGSMLGRMGNNLIRQDIDDITQKSGLNFIINTVQDGEGKVLKVFAGEPVDAHKCGLSHAKEVMRATIPTKGDIVIASPGVKSHEVSLYQSGSRVFGSMEGLVKKGGTVVLVSSCHDGIYEGIGKEKEFFRSLLSCYRGHKEVLN
ncbi:MAG: hypothetical protein AOA65_0534 [Candidatus Bathyarchaeota archaeon BA1]|nr:MAG: hypothetical protein AOA65_0534 [Candidatus Bathyarchaeota archaeon BA1]